ncbi:DUF6053 domain-containing protein [Lysobacter enzymogenes]|uniref:DUF6053 domain-containing protein n=1 Tax=Lysobacter enzymogenes TaxID=69 RepID=UPI003D18EE8D
MGGPSGPTLSFQFARIGSKNIGPEGPPTTAARTVPPPSPLAHAVCAILAVLRFRPRSPA